jgi:hypothetical protein
MVCTKLLDLILNDAIDTIALTSVYRAHTILITIKTLVVALIMISVFGARRVHQR